MIQERDFYYGDARVVCIRRNQDGHTKAVTVAVVIHDDTVHGTIELNELVRKRTHDLGDTIRVAKQTYAFDEIVSKFHGIYFVRISVFLQKYGYGIIHTKMNDQVCYICHDDDHLVRGDCRCRNCYYHYECAQLLTGEDKEYCPLCKSVDDNRPFYNPFDFTYVQNDVLGYGELFMFFVIEDVLSFLNVWLKRISKIIQRMAVPSAADAGTSYIVWITTFIYLTCIGWTLWFRFRRFRDDQRFLRALLIHSFLMLLQELMITLLACERIEKTTLQFTACLMGFCMEIAMRANRIRIRSIYK